MGLGSLFALVWLETVWSWPPLAGRLGLLPCSDGVVSCYCWTAFEKACSRLRGASILYEFRNGFDGFGSGVSNWLGQRFCCLLGI